jgi:uncharacterized protein
VEADVAAAVAEVVVAEDAVVAKTSFADLPQLGVGLGFRPSFRSQLFIHRAQVDFLEVIADHYFQTTPPVGDELQLLANNFKLIPHGLALSLGSAEGLNNEYLSNFVSCVSRLQPAWCSDHIAFTRANGIDIGHLTPLPRTNTALKALRQNIRRLQDHLATPLILENITESFRYPNDQYGDADFLCEICEQNEVGILLDVTNLFINAANHNFDPLTFLYKLPRDKIVQLHFVGATFENGQWQDNHASATQEEIWQLLIEVVKYASVKGIILERDLNLPDLSELTQELNRARTVMREFA